MPIVARPLIAFVLCKELSNLDGWDARGSDRAWVRRRMVGRGMSYQSRGFRRREGGYGVASGPLALYDAQSHWICDVKRQDF